MKELKGILRIEDERIAIESEDLAIYKYLVVAFKEFNGKVVEITIRECGETKCEARCKL